MGNYNPHAPYVIGHEWVPIRQADYVPDTVTERGYTFSIGHGVAPVTGAYYVTTAPEHVVSSACDLISVYPAGSEALTGPVKILHIPVSALTVTGATIDISQGVAALANPSDESYVQFNTPGNAAQLALNFDTASYSQQLYGKRILDVRLRYALSAEPVDLERMNVYGGFARDLINTVLYQSTMVGATNGNLTAISSLSLTDLNPFWDFTTQPNDQRDIYPWRYPELNWFASTTTAAQKLVIMLLNNIFESGSTAALWFADLEVVYCEETRVRYGGRKTTNVFVSTASSVYDAYDPGANLVRLRDVNMASGTTLNPGRYTATVVHNDLNADVAYSGAPIIRAVRELYQLPHQVGVRINQTLAEGEEFTSDDDTVLTHITLHTASSIVTGVHAYGTQVGAPIYGSITATQEVEDDPVGAATSFPQVRFYARRFGITTVPLTLVDVATGLSTVSITVAEFDALDELVDGWKEVTLRFAVAPSFATAAGDVDWRWSATGELAGSQWQIMGSNGPSGSGSALTTGPATYYAPQGNTVDLTWQSPTISGTGEDTLSDAVLIFSQDPLPVSGFGLSLAIQDVSVAVGCAADPCIPSGIRYVNLAWTAQSQLPVTGFGRYEVERYDAIDGEWTLIVSATSRAVTGFADYEARVDVASTYRIRTVNVLDFAGPWVTGGPITVTDPGVVVPGDGNSTLIFTSNAQPSSNLAYTMTWEGVPVEEFFFPEAEEVQAQRMFDRDFFINFHPLERGGERFQRSIIVNAAAIPVPSLANFHSIRDLAWADLDYVCVRDELGNRWYAAVGVPGGSSRVNRTLYVAQLTVSQVTNTPTPVDPA